MRAAELPWYMTTSKWVKEQGHIEGKVKDVAEKTRVAAEYLYGRLNIIDAKISSLLSTNAIYLAAAGIVGDKITLSTSEIDECLVKASAVLWVLSTLICLGVSRLEWEYVDKEASNNQDYIDKIIVVTVFRTYCYNIALAMISCSLVLFGVVSYGHFW